MLQPSSVADSGQGDILTERHQFRHSRTSCSLYHGLPTLAEGLYIISNFLWLLFACSVLFRFFFFFYPLSPSLLLLKQTKESNYVVFMKHFAITDIAFMA